MSEATEPTPASSSSSSTGTTTTTEPSGRVVTTTRTTYAEIDEACAPIGGLLGIPQLVAMVGALMPGGSGLPPEWSAWLRTRIQAGKAIVLACETDGEAWRLEIASAPPAPAPSNGGA